MNISNHRGIGLVEVLVGLFLLAIGVLGFSILQLRAVDASLEANNQVLALTIAQDLAERMRANPQALIDGHYAVGNVTLSTISKDNSPGNPKNTANQDLQNVALHAQRHGMNLSIDKCPVGNTRQCIYVAWEETSLSGERGLENCIKDGVYVQGSHCLFLEAY